MAAIVAAMLACAPLSAAVRADDSGIVANASKSVAAPDEWTQQSIQVACEMFRVSCHEMEVVARCESEQYNPAVIYGPRRGAAGEQGLFQYVGGNRHYMWQRSPWAEFSAYDPQAAAFVTAWNWSTEPSVKTQWSCWRIYFGRGW